MFEQNYTSVPILLTKKQASEYFQVSIGTINNWVKYQKLKAYSIGSKVYFKACELEESLTKINH